MTQNGTITVLDPNGLVESSRLKVSMFPNPVVDRVAIESAEVVTRVEIMDANGRLIDFENFYPSTSTKYINTYDLESGMYFFSIHTENGIAVKQLIKN